MDKNETDDKLRDYSKESRMEIDMTKNFRIHGDNIVECERIASLIINETKPANIRTSLLSPSTIVFDIDFCYHGLDSSWHIELLPGFNKSGRRRWQENIFHILRSNGSFLDETPDAIITSVDGEMETILCAIEFCSALQAGNQAWQRSGRAFSTGRTGCPYLYIVDFVKYELDSRTRERKALRFPNPAVPYSYINFSKTSDHFVAQIYVRSEEFDPLREKALAGFDENDFAEQELSAYLVKKMCGLSTEWEEQAILQKNLNVVSFLARSCNPKSNFTPKQWECLYDSQQGIVPFSIENAGFHFHKTITAKGHHGKSPQVLELIDQCSVGFASRDLPIGIIPAKNRERFTDGIRRLYPSFDEAILLKMADSKSDLILCLIKGFKPRGDDNRPDRGLLPLATMLSSTDAEVMTYLYGPVLAGNYHLLLTNPKRLAAANGLWKAILSLSNFLALDVPILSGSQTDAELLMDTADLKEYFTKIENGMHILSGKVFPSIPQEYHEDDVDTGIHYIFAHLLRNFCFEGMCNPPGGDWSGFSVLHKGSEKRWLSLPRVSKEVQGKRPDHILELFGVFDKPLLLSIESKERAIDLEPNVGEGLVNYIKNLMNYIPNVERTVHPYIGVWTKSSSHVAFTDFEIISAAAYLRSAAQDAQTVFQNSQCDLLFVMQPQKNGWTMEMIPNTIHAQILKNDMIQKMQSLGIRDCVIF